MLTSIHEIPAKLSQQALKNCAHTAKAASLFTSQHQKELSDCVFRMSVIFLHFTQTLSLAEPSNEWVSSSMTRRFASTRATKLSLFSQNLSMAVQRNLRQLSSADAKRWHQRLGHPGIGPIQHLQSHVRGAIVTGSLLHQCDCDTCKQANSEQQPSRQPREKSPV